VAQTLHRLLGWQPHRHDFAWSRLHRMPHRVVIVDEGSMIDLALMDRLLEALADDARLLILGDADQLPSVEVGAVFRDLVAAGGDRAVRLTESYRMRVDDPAGGLQEVRTDAPAVAALVAADRRHQAAERTSRQVRRAIQRTGSPGP
jgi:ATP-dependent exoDNAse (exonuclease V) alpha subunit